MSMKLNKIKKDSHKLTLAKARIIAHCIGDGCVFKTKHNYTIRYEVKNLEQLNEFERDIFEVYGLKVIWCKNPSGKTGELIDCVFLRSKLVFEDLHKYTPSYYSYKWVLPKQIVNSNVNIKIEFLKAFFDDEGSVINAKNKLIKLYSVNRKGLIQVKKLIEAFGICCKIYGGYGLKRNVFGIVIRGKDIPKFAKEIGFNSKVKQDKLMNLVK